MPGCFILVDRFRELADDGAAVAQEGEEALHEKRRTFDGIVAHASDDSTCAAGQRTGRGASTLASPMARPKPSAVPPDRIPPKKIPPSPEQIAKAAVARRPKVIGMDRVEVTFRFTLSRAAMERLVARAIREGRRVESVVADLLEDE